MNIFADFHARVAALIEKRIAAGELPPGLDLSRFVVEPPRDATHGDLSTNAALTYARDAKAAGTNPRKLAEGLAADIAREPEVANDRSRRPRLYQYRPEARSLRGRPQVGHERGLAVRRGRAG